MKRLLATAFLLLSTAGTAFTVFGAEGEVISSPSYVEYKTVGYGERRAKHCFMMTSATSGKANDSTATITMSGKIRLIYVDHDGTVSDNFDITLVDSDGKDWLYGDGANFDSTNSDTDNQRMPATADTGAIIEIPNISVFASGANFGASKTVYFYVIEGE
jgi:hypothetical protein